MSSVHPGVKDEDIALELGRVLFVQGARMRTLLWSFGGFCFLGLGSILFVQG